MDDTQARLTRLEERYMYLQKHVTDQDRVIMELADTVEHLRRELSRVRRETPTAGVGDDAPADERPPHY